MPDSGETILLTNRDVHLMAVQIVEQAWGLDSEQARQRHDELCGCGEPASRSQWARVWGITSAQDRRAALDGPKEEEA